MFLTKAVIALFMSVFDIEHTKRKLHEYGTGIEMNPFIPFLSKLIGLDRAVTLGIIVPTGLLVGLGWFYPSVLTFALGAKFVIFVYQMRSYGVD